MFAGCLAEMQDITTAQVGDKTMMDALIPAVKAAQACAAPDDGPVDVLMAAAEAAEEGARASEGFASKFGRARSYGGSRVHLAVLARAGERRLAAALVGNPACRIARRAFLFRLSND